MPATTATPNAQSLYSLVRYAADGHAGESGSLHYSRGADGTLCRTYGDSEVVAGGLTHEQAVERVRELCGEGWYGVSAADMRWTTDDGEEAYHEGQREGCGGYVLRPE